MEKLEKTDFLLIWFRSTICLFIIYGMFLRMHYSVDSYASFYENDVTTQLWSARYIHYIIGTFLLKHNINRVIYQPLFTMVFIFSLSWCISRLTQIINLLTKSNFIFSWLAVLISFVNVFILEWFLYPETTLIYSIAIICAIEALLIIIKGQQLQNYCFSLLMLIISLFSYQAVMPIFIIYYLTLIILKNNFKITYVSLKEAFGGIIVGFVGSVIMLVLQKIINIDGDRTASLDFVHLLDNARALITYQKELWTAQLGLFFPYILILLMLSLTILFIWVLYNKSTCRESIMLLLILTINYIIIFVPHLLTKDLWLPGRTIVAFWSFISSIGILLFYLQRNNKIIIQTTFLSFIAILFLNVSFIWQIGFNHFKSNYYDYQYVKQIQREIDSYERNTGNEITKISTCRDDDFEYYYKDVKFSSYDTNTKCFSVEWGDVNSINYYTGRSYDKIEMNSEIYDKHFNHRNWDSFISDEQLKFIDDTLYICFY